MWLSGRSRRKMSVAFITTNGWWWCAETFSVSQFPQNIVDRMALAGLFLGNACHIIIVYWPQKPSSVASADDIKGNSTISKTLFYHRNRTLVTGVRRIIENSKTKECQTFIRLILPVVRAAKPLRMIVRHLPLCDFQRSCQLSLLKSYYDHWIEFPK